MKKQAPAPAGLRSFPALDFPRFGFRDSGILLSRKRRASLELLPEPLTLSAPSESVSAFGHTLAFADPLLFVGGRLGDRDPFAVLYRVTKRGLVREQLMRGSVGQLGPVLATDGTHLAVGQPGPTGGSGTAAVYAYEGGAVRLEARFSADTLDARGADFGERVALGHDLLVLGHGASLEVYRHSGLGWLSSGSLAPALPYPLNPKLGQSLALLPGRVLVGNPLELDGDQVGPGRVLVMRHSEGHLEAEAVLAGDANRLGRREPRLGFGCHMHAQQELLAICSPRELARDGSRQSRVYVYETQAGTLSQLARIDVPSCHGGVCLAGERLFVLGDALYVHARRGRSFELTGSYDVGGASVLASSGELLALANPIAGRVNVYPTAQL